MSPDDICLVALKAQFVRVDQEAGLAFSYRSNRAGPLGCRNTKGYLVATIHYGKFRRQIKIHRLVWIAAHGPIPDGSVIDHINRIKDDNRISNLRLACPVLNSRNRRSYAGIGNPSVKIDPLIAAEIRSAHGFEKSYSKVAWRFGVSKSLVAQIVRGERWGEGIR